jgi:hypothetical protein
LIALGVFCWLTALDCTECMILVEFWHALDWGKWQQTVKVVGKL